MLMQPQSPNPNFDFMLKDQPKTNRGFNMPNLPKPVKIGLGIIVGLILIAIVGSLLSGRNSGKSQSFAGVMARASETIRVTAAAQQLQLQDPQTQALAATVNASFSSDQQQISAYLAGNHIKVSKAQLAADTDKTTDSSLQTASQNNGLDAAYVSYIQGALTKYETDLENAAKGAGPNGKKILTSSIESVRTLLNSAPIKS